MDTAPDRTSRHQEALAVWQQRNPIRRWRVSKGHSLTSLAACCGVHRSSLHRFESLYTDLPTTRLVAIATGLGLRPGRMLDAWVEWLRSKPTETTAHRYLAECLIDDLKEAQ